MPFAADRQIVFRSRNFYLPHPIYVGVSGYVDQVNSVIFPFHVYAAG